MGPRLVLKDCVFFYSLFSFGSCHPVRCNSDSIKEQQDKQADKVKESSPTRFRRVDSVPSWAVAYRPSPNNNSGDGHQKGTEKDGKFYNSATDVVNAFLLTAVPDDHRPCSHSPGGRNVYRSAPRVT